VSEDLIYPNGKKDTNELTGKGGGENRGGTRKKEEQKKGPVGPLAELLKEETVGF